MSKNKRINKKAINSALTKIDGLDEEKQSVFANMKHDFEAHLSDLQSDRSDRHRRAIAATRQMFQSLLMQIPSNIQNLTMEDIYSKGGSVELTDDPNNEKKSFIIKIPKSTLNSSNELSQVLSSTKRCDPLRDLQKLAVIRSASAKKTTERPNPRILTRSALKTTQKSATNDEKRWEPFSKSNVKHKCEPKTIVEEDSEQKFLKSLSTGPLKPPRKPNPNEEIITLAFSSSGTPLVMENKGIERINKSK